MAQTQKRHTMTCTYGYVWVSTTDQNLSIQRAALQAAGYTLIREEKRSGTSIVARAELRTLLGLFGLATHWWSPGSTA